MTSFYYASTSTRGNWFQTNQPEHESDDCAGDTATSGCVTNDKNWHFSGKFDLTFVTLLWCSKTKITERTGILVHGRVLWWDMIFKICWQFWYSFFKNTLESSNNINFIEITFRKNGTFNLFDTSVNGNVTFTYTTYISLKQCIGKLTSGWKPKIQVLVNCLRLPK